MSIEECYRRLKGACRFARFGPTFGAFLVLASFSACSWQPLGISLPGVDKSTDAERSQKESADRDGSGGRSTQFEASGSEALGADRSGDGQGIGGTGIEGGGVGAGGQSLPSSEQDRQKSPKPLWPNFGLDRNDGDQNNGNQEDGSQDGRMAESGWRKSGWRKSGQWERRWRRAGRWKPGRRKSEQRKPK